MGKTQSTGNLTNALAQDSSNNIGIGGAVNASFKLQVTGATNLTSDLTVNGLTVGRGAGAIASNTTVGSGALPVNTTGTLNTAIGNLSLQTNTTGYGNTSVGYNAIGYNTTGFFNAAIGVNALLFNSTGTYNNALGTAALYANTTGSYNTAVGQQAGTANTTGSNNTYIGYSSGFNITTGSNNTIIGRYFGTAAMANNIVLADGAGNVRYQWDGTNNVFGNPLSGTSATFTEEVSARNGNISIGLDATYSIPYMALGWGGRANANNKIYAARDATDGIIINSATGRGVVINTNGGATNALTIASTGAATFSSSVTAATGLYNGYTSGLPPTSGSATRGGLRLNNASNIALDFGTVAAGQAWLQVSDANNYASNFALLLNPNGGNVGIGTSSPTAKVHAVNSGNGFIYRFAGGTSSEITGGIFASTAAGFASIGTTSNHPFNIFTNDTDRLTVTSGGNVGIGTSSPTSYGGFTTLNINNATNGGLIDLLNNGTRVGTFFNTSSDVNIGSITSVPFIFYTANTERMRITSIASGGYTKISNYGGYINVNGNYHEIITNRNNENIAYLTNTASSPYGPFIYFLNAAPNNTTNYFLQCADSSVTCFTIWSNGTTSGRSDIRLKKNIVDATPKLDKLMQLRLVNYEWKESIDGGKELGLIAQEVEEIFPNLVITEPIKKKREIEQEDGIIIEEEYIDGDSKSIKNSVLPYITIKALQELTTLVQEQQAQIEELKELIKNK